MAIKGNKGEWSEFYAFLKILTEGKMFAADKNLEILKDSFFIVLEIIREESEGAKYYDISKNDGKIVINGKDKEFISVVELKKIKTSVAVIFNEMKKSKSTTFRILLAEDIMKKLYCSQIKASNGRKADLMVVLHDKKSPTFSATGFSVKSMLGSPSTLLNASGATNFIYRIIEEKKDNKIKNSNKASTIRDKTKQIYGDGGHIEFVEMESENFRKNLRKIDGKFHEIMAEIIKYYYNGGGQKISDLVNCVAENKQFCEKLDFTKDDFVFKVKRFLSDIALGMTPSKEWDGYTKACGGYIIVKENGEVVCYHLYNRDQFEEYLFNNTKLDTPSTTRHKFGNVYEQDGEKRIKYNLQIRFLK